MRPCSGVALAPRRLGRSARLGLARRRFFGLRSFLAVSSVACGRIEFVLQTLLGPSSLRTIHSLPVALHHASRRRSYFPLLAFSSTREGLTPSCAHSLSSALGTARCAVPAACSGGTVCVVPGSVAMPRVERSAPERRGDAAARRPYRRAECEMSGLGYTGRLLSL